MSAAGVVVLGPIRSGSESVITSDSLQFLAELHRKFEKGRRAILADRERRQVELDKGKFPTSLAETEAIRKGDWKGAKVVHDLEDRRVEITGPVDRKMIINALNSGAKVFMADFEDSTAPTWDNLISGHINLRDAIERTITFEQAGKHYQLNSSNLATLMVRPRGWHLPEAHILVDGDVMSGSLFDFGLHFFHNAKRLLSKGSGPYFYLPKMEGHKEARLWNEVFLYSQKRLGIPSGTIRATVLIETILAAFEMDEILYELREHSAGLNIGRWDYIFSFIKKFRSHPQFVTPDRAQVTMTTPFMANYVKLLIQTCHRRGVHAMGGMAAQIPINNNPQANQIVLDKVTADKLREVTAGCDGTWVAHPGLIPIALSIFNQHMPTPNQISKSRPAVSVSAKDLLDLGPKGTITRAGLQANLDVGLNYTEAWLRGLGCVPLHNLMEDAATAEISRCQVWQWIKHGSKTSEGDAITKDYIKKTLNEIVAQQNSALGDDVFSNKRRYKLAHQLFEQMCVSDRLEDFLTLIAYPYITTTQNKKAASIKSKL